jgi:hypothetical protein
MTLTWVTLLSVLGQLSLAAGAAAQSGGAPEQGFQAIVERPLFDPSRRHRVAPQPTPIPFASASAPQSAARPFAATLVGVVAGEGQAIVLLRAHDDKVLRLGEGEVIEGWRIVAIHTRSIELERDGVRQNLWLPELKSGE